MILGYSGRFETLEEMKRHYLEGFNGASISYENVEGWSSLSTIGKISALVEYAKQLKSIGYYSFHFSPPSDNYALILLIKQLMYQGINFKIYFDEIYNCIEKKECSWEYQRDWITRVSKTVFEYSGRKVIIGTQIRNWKNVEKLCEGLDVIIIPSTYWASERKWTENYTPFGWIMGELHWDFQMFFYKHLAKNMRNKNITEAWLYQGNTPRWDSDGWCNAIWKFLGILDSLRKWNRRRFIKHFRG